MLNFWKSYSISSDYILILIVLGKFFCSILNVNENTCNKKVHQCSISLLHLSLVLSSSQSPLQSTHLPNLFWTHAFPILWIQSSLITGACSRLNPVLDNFKLWQTQIVNITVAAFQCKFCGSAGYEWLWNRLNTHICSYIPALDVWKMGTFSIK